MKTFRTCTVLLLVCFSFFILPPRSLAETLPYAMGAALQVNSKVVDSENQITQFTPEVFGYRYLKVGNSTRMRLGLRLGYSGTNPNKDISSSINITESDLRGIAEIAFILDYSIFHPAVILGGGTAYRKTRLKISEPMVPSDESISGTRLLPLAQFQFSLGVSLFKNFLEVAPFVRNTAIALDHRTDWSYGSEVSMRLLE